jgi:tetrapyrrole methylase family protein / MazG family protein
VGPERPRVVVVGLGPAGAELLAPGVADMLAGPRRVYLRTARHPAASAFEGAGSFDHLYESAGTFEEVYAAIVDHLVLAAEEDGEVVYAVPGSPLVAERTVDLLRRDERVDVHVVPALSFLDLAWSRLAIDPLGEGVRVVDAGSFPGPGDAALVGQCWTRQLLSEIKLSAGEAVDLPRPVILHHLGLEDEVVLEVDWWDLDRTLEPDHLTSVYVPASANASAHASASAGVETQRLVALMDTLRERCPWDRAQTHATLAPHLVEETYEVLDALTSLGGPHDTAGSAHLEEELGDLLFQIVFHARLAAESGRFDLGDVARGVHDKLVRRHPHVFGSVQAENAERVEQNWEAIKKSEKGRSSITEGIPSGLPALMLADTLARKARSVGLDPAGTADAPGALEALLDAAPPDRHPDDPRTEKGAIDRLVGEILFSVADLAQRSGIDAEQALRAYALEWRDEIVAAEGVPEGLESSH